MKISINITKGVISMKFKKLLSDIYRNDISYEEKIELNKKTQRINIS